MKYLGVFLLFFTLNSLAQKQGIIRIDSLPKKGILLNKNWKWHAGDNPDFAKVDFDDSTWESIDPTKDIMDLPQIWKTEIVWFRLRFIADSSIVNKSLVMQVNQTGASEIFLNGQFIEKFGEINTLTHQIQAATPINGSFIGLPIRKKGEQVLSVRFAIQKNIFYVLAQGHRNVALSLRVMEASSTSFFIENNIVPYFEFSRFGLFLIISILHFALFCLRKSQKANLYFFLYAFFYAISSLLISLAYNQVYFAATKMIFLFTTYSLLIVGYMFFLTAIYSLFNRKRGFIYWLLFVYEIVGFVLFLMNYRNGFDIAITIPVILIFLESVRITFLANRRKLRGSNIIIVGSISFAVFFALFYLIKMGYLPSGPKSLYGHLSITIGMICIPISISIYLALESAFTNNSLRLKLVEVENLSAEKQQILSAQNETLEKQVNERTAELQLKNRDLEIEAALERVRSRSMAMHKSEELLEVIKVVFIELQNLGFKMENASFITHFQDDYWDFWQATPEYVYPTPIRIPYFNHPVFEKSKEAISQKLDLLTLKLNYEEKNEWWYHLFKHTIVNNISEERKKYLLNTEGLVSSTVYMKNIALAISNYDNYTYADQENQILKRFGNSFDQAYTRCIDLQKAEAQAEQAKLDLIQIQTEKKRSEEALFELRITQNQLIQKEKLASLGELTAGIAHEIQNPLNFVNNFSELSCELIDEMNEEIEKGDTEEVKAIAGDLKLNLEKINHHGKRASSIVKGMLEHSRASTGVKELTDINALADEYLRLSYHGLRAKDSSFNADFKTNFDKNLPKVEVIPQDFGRVLLNIINNAFYAVLQRKNLQGLFHDLTGLYIPKVVVSTEQIDNQVIIKVTDNGTGMSEATKAKIFQPFFTTKPTGQGTGLGLSLAYDIITKGHGGTLEVESIEGEGTIFLIKLPIQ